MAERERRLRFAEDDLDLPDFGDRAAVNCPPDLVGHSRIDAGRDRHFRVIVMEQPIGVGPRKLEQASDGGVEEVDEEPPPARGGNHAGPRLGL